MKKKELIERFIECLSILAYKIKIRSSLNLMDLNIHAEYFFKDLLNIVYGLNLKNINIEERNSAAIDLADEDNMIAIQVTSNVNWKKIRDTLNLFFDKKMNLKYKRLIFLSLTEKVRYKKYTGFFDGFFDIKKDVIDYKDLAAFIENEPCSQIEKIIEFLESELNCGNIKHQNKVERVYGDVWISEVFHNIDSIEAESFIWHKLSNIFYRDKRIGDGFFSYLITDSKRLGFEDKVLSLIHYYYSRILYKQGDKYNANQNTIIATKYANQSKDDFQERMLVLLNARLIIESDQIASNSKYHMLNNLTDKLLSYKLNDIYYVSEKSSLLGRLAEISYSEIKTKNMEITDCLSSIVAEHADLLSLNTFSSHKQSLVAIFLRIMGLLWDDKITINKKIQELYLCLSIGECECVKQKNSIFYMQMLLLKSIILLLEKKKELSWSMICFVCILLKSNNISLNHEGVKQYYDYLKIKHRYEAKLLYDIYYSYYSIELRYSKSHEWFNYVIETRIDIYNIPIAVFT